jgi:hypothetical protein
MPPYDLAVSAQQANASVLSETAVIGKAPVPTCGLVASAAGPSFFRAAAHIQMTGRAVLQCACGDDFVPAGAGQTLCGPCAGPRPWRACSRCEARFRAPSRTVRWCARCTS